MEGQSLWTWQQVPAPSPGQSITEQDAFVSHAIPFSRNKNRINENSPQNHFQG
jgi:hypothetical protein